jgi:signal transduction histidine kinase
MERSVVPVLSLRTKILAAILAGVVLTDLLSVWVVNDRMEAGARREADSQARAHTAQAQALYAQRAATLAAEGEAVSFYPAVAAALADGNRVPLVQWSSQVAAAQGMRVTVLDANGTVIARGHAPDRIGDQLAPLLPGLQLALAGQPRISGTEDGDDLGLALRGYAPVVRNGTLLGAIMLAEPFDDALLRRLAGSAPDGAAEAWIAPPSPGNAPSEVCNASGGVEAVCSFSLLSPAGQPAATLSLRTSLAAVERARTDAQLGLWLVGGAVLVVGTLAAWLLSNSLSRPLERLTHAADRMAAGAYGKPGGHPEPSGRDEIGRLAHAFEGMRAQVAAATDVLRDERDVLDAVLESTDDGILMVDATGEPVVANARWSVLLGRGDLAVHDVTRLDGGDSLADAALGWMDDPDDVVGAEFERIGPPYVRLRCYSAPVRYREGIWLGRIVVVRDVTRESEAERMRTALVSTVSHELRSPLTAIKGYVDTLLGSSWAPETTREFLQIVAQSADKLAALVDSLLDAAKLEAGVLQLEREPARLERIVQQTVGHLQPLTPSSHPLRLDLAPDLPLANADPVRVEQVLTNLIENAIKYSPDGGAITVCVRGEPELTVSVSDHGIGVAPEHAEHLFERFYRVEHGLARTTKGVGLGLFICKNLVEAHSGRLWMTSDGPGAGSTFWFTLPRLEEPHAPARAEPQPHLAPLSR